MECFTWNMLHHGGKMDTKEICHINEVMKYRKQRKRQMIKNIRKRERNLDRAHNEKRLFMAIKEMVGKD